MSQGSPYRELHRACIHPETYKYFFTREEVPAVWGRLKAEFGEPRSLPSVHVVEIETRRLLLRATSAGNPITVIRKRSCGPEDIARLHALFGFREDG